MKSGLNLDPQGWHSKIYFLVNKNPKTGKWLDQQKQIFIRYCSLLEELSNKYVLMTKHIPSRSAAQIRSHWQKFNEKRQRDKQKIGRNSSREDFVIGFHFFKIQALDYGPETKESLLKMRSFLLKIDVSYSGKPSCFSTRSTTTRGSQMENQTNQDVFYGAKRVQNYLIEQSVWGRNLQKGEQLQKFGKGVEESNTLSSIELMQRESENLQRPKIFEDLKHKKIYKREKKWKQ